MADLFEFSLLQCFKMCHPFILASLPNLATNQSNLGRRRPSRWSTWQDTPIIIFTTRVTYHTTQYHTWQDTPIIIFTTQHISHITYHIPGRTHRDNHIYHASHIIWHMAGSTTALMIESNNKITRAREISWNSLMTDCMLFGRLRWQMVKIEACWLWYRGIVPPDL